MSRESLVIVCGLLIAFAPRFGISGVWKQWIIFGLGMLIVVLGYSLRRSAFFRSIEDSGEHRADNFVEQRHLKVEHNPQHGTLRDETEYPAV
jgi:hypothetical protein